FRSQRRKRSRIAAGLMELPVKSGVAVSSFCLGCGNSIAEGERFCAACGRDSQAGANMPAVDPQVAFGLPPETSNKAIFSLVCGILFIILPFSIVAVIFGYIALSEIRK